MKTTSPRAPRSTPKGRQLDADAQRQIRALLGDAPRDARLLIEFLHRIQDNYRQISAEHIAALADELKLSQVEVYEVASFYHHFDVVKQADVPAPDFSIRVCNGLSCEMAGARQLLLQLTEKYQMPLRVLAVPCIGRCESAPAVCVGQHAFGDASLEKIGAVVEARRITADCAPLVQEHDRAVFAADAYAGLARCLAGGQSREQVFAALDDAGLRGLGGAGFPSGRKWRIVANQPAPRLMAVNIDEGEPGTFKDRWYLEHHPQGFLQGMLIAAWAVDVTEIYVYLRDEYHAIRALLQRELDGLEANLAGLLAQHPWRLPTIHLRRGAGAYICGEESAMLESIQGKRGLPRLRPPYVAERGLFDRPTLVQNLETLYWAAEILNQGRAGAAAFAEHGRHGRTGLRSFSVSGRVVKPGVHLAPAGITLAELLAEYCGGMLPGHTLYAYLPGGASGGILPASLANVPLDFDTLQPYGCFIGSAAIVVLSQHDTARNAACNALQFFKHESCGQCTPCRVGTAKAVDLMREKSWNADLLHDLAQVMQDASICGLGQAAPNPFLSVLKYFPHEVK